MAWTIEWIRDAELDPAEVFRCYVDPSTWGAWGHTTRWARGTSPVVAGAVVHVKASYGSVYAVRIRRIVTGASVVCQVHTIGLDVVSTFEVVPTDAGCRLRHRLDVSGPLSRVLAVLRYERIYHWLLSRETRRLVEFARSARDGRAAAALT